ncbi:MAG TPA: LAGLIDADG family homing endonuclease, partial [Chthonomonadaceae bacterium]|nr:LAGLIDADG family homing endonuclease [Chthonomonadaceae bacterium]
MTQDPNPHQTDIDSVIHQDDTETPTTNVSLATNGNTSGNGRAVVKVSPAANGKRKSLRPNNAPGLTVERRFTKPGEDVYSTVEWELRDAVISNERGEKVFEQKDVEIPKTWTQLATNVVVSKYFRGHLGTPQRERSVRQLIHRVADTMANWGRAMDYFATEADAQAFQDELTHILLHQKAAFNSPVWFNVGLPDQPRPQCSACFINSVEDTMESILTLAKTEGMLFKYGSGTGTNLSPIRGSREPLQGGGTASGPISFMRGFDQFAGAIKCLTPDAYVYTDRGLQTLGEVLDTTLPPGFHSDESVVLATKDGPTRISHIYVSPEAETFRLRLRHTGLALRGTAEHPVLTLTPEFELVWKRLTDLAVGDRVAVSRRTEMWPTSAPSFGDFEPRAPWAKKSLSYPTEMTPELARLLGYMVSEGSLDDERFRFSNADEDVFQDFLACVRAVFGVDPTLNVRRRVHPKTGVTTWLFEACWTNAVRFLTHVGLTTARSDAKTVPWSVRCAPRAHVIEFLRAYFEGDGHISTHVYAASASKALLSEVQLLLLNLGMVAALRPHPVNGKTYWSLHLRGEQAWLFVQEVGFVSARKRQAAQFAGDKNTNVDTVPFLAEVLRVATQVFEQSLDVDFDVM